MTKLRILHAAWYILAGGLFVFFANASASESVGGGGPLFAVIPTLGIGGPLAILALLFPSLFGGVLVLFRQWGAYFAVISVVSLLFCFQLWFGYYLTDTWWGTQTALWLTTTFITLAGAAWAWRRNVTALKGGDQQQAPARTENLVLWLLSACCAGSFVYFKLAGLPFDSMWALMAVLSIGLWIGTLYKLYRTVAAKGSPVGDLPTEGVMLGTMVAVCIVLVWLRAAPADDTSEFGAATPGQPIAQRDKVKVSKSLLKHFDTNFGVEVDQGMVLSSPLVAGDKVFIALAHTDDFDTKVQFPEKHKGALVCMDRKTKQAIWTFTDEVTEELVDPQSNKPFKKKTAHMQPVYSSPCLADGRLYIGEGFHYNPKCKLYCLNPNTTKKEGEKLWDFQTNSQVESTPCVADGKVFFGAGNDGIYALNATTGKQAWHYLPKQEKIFRVGASPIVANGKVYFGSGVDRDDPKNCDMALVCLDAATGKEIWKIPSDLPCWAAPVLDGDVIFFALGNGDIYTDDLFLDGKHRGGAVLCLDAKTGKEIWRFDVDKGVHTRPALDGQSIYFGSRDGNVYCLDRFTTKQRWKVSLGSPVFASPILDQGNLTGRAVNVFVVSQGYTLNGTGANLGHGGKVECLDAQTGKAHWKFNDLWEQETLIATTPAVVSTATALGIQRQIYFGVWLKAANQPYLYCLEDLLTISEAKPSDNE